MRIPWGLRSRIAVGFAMLALLVTVAACGLAYVLASNFLIAQREDSATARTLANADRVNAALESSTVDIATTLAALPAADQTQRLLHARDRWYSAGVTIPPSALPASLLKTTASSNGAHQRFAVGSEPYLAIAVKLNTSTYVEVFPLTGLQSTLTTVGMALAVPPGVAVVLGGLVGWSAGRRLMRPLRSLAESTRRIAEGEISTRLPATRDRDLAPIVHAFNEMATAVESRIARERRFAANVSHELRSPLTTMLATTDVLEQRIERIPEREAVLVSLLAAQTRRFSALVLDLLELGKVAATSAAQAEFVPLRAVLENVLAARDIPIDRISGTDLAIRTDARHLERIVGNLVDNAEIHGGGVVRLVLVAPPPQRGTPPDRVPCARLHVDDAGPGIPQEDAPALFEPFVHGRGAGTAGGAGLGLALVLEHAHAIGATVTTGRSPESGARFTVDLPEMNS